MMDKKLKHAQNITDRFQEWPSYTKVVSVLRDRKGDRYTNVPHIVIHHSPDGYEWGFSGSGPADFALNLCELALRHIGYDGPRTRCWDGDCFVAAFEMHQEAKRWFIIRLNRSDDLILWDYIVNWVRQWLVDSAEERDSPASLAAAWPSLTDAPDGNDIFADRYGPPSGNVKEGEENL